MGFYIVFIKLRSEPKHHSIDALLVMLLVVSKVKLDWLSICTLSQSAISLVINRTSTLFLKISLNNVTMLKYI